MIRGLYASATGMLALMSKQNVIANNLANVNTPGFKRDYASLASFQEALVYASEKRAAASYAQTPIGWLSSGVGVGETGFINSTGVMRQTGGTFDLALSGDGFFAVQTPSGEMYTRNGSFTRDALGRLVSQDGHFALGENGPITVSGNEVLIDESGKVSVDGDYVDTLKLRSFAKGELEKAGSNVFAAYGEGRAPDSVMIRQGFLEGSNVNSTNEMVDMVATVRAFEANQRVLKTQDEILGKAVNDVGRFA